MNSSHVIASTAVATRIAHGAPADPEIILADLVQLADWMAHRGHYGKTDIAEAIRKPWKYGEEIELVRRIRAHEDAHPNHTCRPGAPEDGDEPWYCDTGSDEQCEWSDSIPI